MKTGLIPKKWFNRLQYWGNKSLVDIPGQAKTADYPLPPPERLADARSDHLLMLETHQNEAGKVRAWDCGCHLKSQPACQ